jgi:hypothetical protein
MKFICEIRPGAGALKFRLGKRNERSFVDIRCFKAGEPTDYGFRVFLGMWPEFLQAVYKVEAYLLEEGLIDAPTPLLPVKPGNKYKILLLYDSGLSQKEISRTIGVNKAYTCRIIKSASEDKLIAPRLTPKGWAALSK